MSTSRIELTEHAKAHPLFPLLDFLVKSSLNHQKQLEALNTRVTTVEKECSDIKGVQKELQRMIKEFGESSFQIEKTVYQVSLRKGAANLFCESLFRQPVNESVSRMVRTVLRDDVRVKYKLDAALKYVSGLLATFRSEERRRIIIPTGKYKNQNTKQLAKLILNYLKASDDVLPIYCKYVALLRRYIRETENAKEQKNIHAQFKDWATNKFPPSGEPSLEQWTQIMDEDKDQNYSVSAGSGIAIGMYCKWRKWTMILKMPFSLIALICIVLYDDFQSWIIINCAVLIFHTF